jgi:hypothetical protein
MQLVPVTLPNGYEAGGAWSRTVWLRPWCGTDEIFITGIDTAMLAPAARTTALLSRCVYLAEGTRRAGRAFVRDLAAGDREALLLHLRRVTLGDRLSCVLSCRTCGSLMDLELKVHELLVAPYESEGVLHEARVVTEAGTMRVRFRLPCGADQEAVVALARRDPVTAARAVVERCVDQIADAATGEARPLSEEVVDRIAEAMAERDPQAELLLNAACPGCGARATAVFDPTSYVHQEISQHVDTLLRQVHVLASHYHWSELQILRLTWRRRRKYLDLIAASRQPAGRPA